MTEKIRPKIWIYILIFIVLLISTFIFLDKISPTNLESTNQEETSPIEKTQSITRLGQELIKIDKTRGSYFCFITNEFIDEIQISEILNYLTMNNQEITFTGPDVTFNHNPNEPNEYICYNSIDPKEGISCWNNLINPIIPNPSCFELLSSNNSTLR